MKNFKLFFSLLVLLVFVSCNNNDDDDGPTIIVENEINEFVYNGLNSWYFYYDDVPNLQDDRFNNIDEKNTYINSFSSPEAIFNALQHPNDRFSIIVSNYETLNNSQQGISESFGYDFGLILINEQDIIGYVQYVLPGGPAENAGLQRGDIFFSVNGNNLNLDNYVDLLFRNTSYTLGLAEFEGEQLIPNGEEVSMTAIQLTENPVFLTKTIELPDGTKVGYLVYNRFTYTFHSELNAAFAQLVNEGAQELVLDLRYNLGGSVYTAMHLASMIYDRGTTQTVFGAFLHNSKKSDSEDFVFPFLESVDVLDADFESLGNEAMNRLDLQRVFVLTSGSTASASELIINGLEPYMDVILVGTTTVGKNEGSITLYDNPSRDYQERSGANPNHKYAMQPIINRLSNAEGFTEYVDGFTPEEVNVVSETEDLANMKQLGDPEETLLKRALEIINPSIARLDNQLLRPIGRHFDNSKNHKKFEEGMFFDGIQNFSN